jgi:hypothetical protein
MLRGLNFSKFYKAYTKLQWKMSIIVKIAYLCI